MRAKGHLLVLLLLAWHAIGVRDHDHDVDEEDGAHLNDPVRQVDKETAAALQEQLKDVGPTGMLISSLVDAGAASAGIDKVLKMLVEEVKPGIIDAHNDAVLLLQTIIEAFDNCDVYSSRLIEKKNGVLVDRDSHLECRAGEGKVEEIKVACNTLLDSQVETREATCKHLADLTLDPGKDPTCINNQLLAYNTWLEWVNDDITVKIGNWLEANHSCTKAREAEDKQRPLCEVKDQTHADKRESCNEFQGGFETAFCSLIREADDTCDNYQNCYARALSELNENLPNITHEEAQRKITFRAVSRIECFLRVLNTNSAGTTNQDQGQNGLDVCRNQTHDTSHLDIVYPPTPATMACFLPGDGPCVQVFLAAHYSNVPHNARIKPCKSCSAGPGWETQVYEDFEGARLGRVCTQCDPLEGWMSPDSGALVSVKSGNLDLPLGETRNTTYLEVSGWRKDGAETLTNESNTLAQNMVYEVKFDVFTTSDFGDYEVQLNVVLTSNPTDWVIGHLGYPKRTLLPLSCVFGVAQKEMPNLGVTANFFSTGSSGPLLGKHIVMSFLDSDYGNTGSYQNVPLYDNIMLRRRILYVADTDPEQGDRLLLETFSTDLADWEHLDEESHATLEPADKPEFCVLRCRANHDCGVESAPTSLTYEVNTKYILTFDVHPFEAPEVGDFAYADFEVQLAIRAGDGKKNVRKLASTRNGVNEKQSGKIVYTTQAQSPLLGEQLLVRLLWPQSQREGQSMPAFDNVKLEKHGLSVIL